MGLKMYDPDRKMDVNNFVSSICTAIEHPLRRTRVRSVILLSKCSAPTEPVS